MVESQDILSALEVMGVYLPNYSTVDEKLAALVGALEAIQVQVKTEKDKKVAEELERQRIAQRVIQIESTTQQIKMKAEELMAIDETLTVADAMLKATQEIAAVE